MYHITSNVDCDAGLQETEAKRRQAEAVAQLMAMETLRMVLLCRHATVLMRGQEQLQAQQARRISMDDQQRTRRLSAELAPVDTNIACVRLFGVVFTVAGAAGLQRGHRRGAAAGRASACLDGCRHISPHGSPRQRTTAQTLSCGASTRSRSCLWIDSFALFDARQAQDRHCGVRAHGSEAA